MGSDVYNGQWQTFAFIVPEVENLVMRVIVAYLLPEIRRLVVRVITSCSTCMFTYLLQCKLDGR